MIDGDVGERLAGILDRFVDLGMRAAFARLHPQLQPPVTEPDEDLVLDRHDRVRAGALVLAARRGPLLVMRARPGIVAITSGVDECGRALGAVAAQRPAEDPHVVDAIAHLEHGQQLVLRRPEVGEPALAEESDELVELRAEVGIGEEVPWIVFREGSEARLVRRHVARNVQREHLLGLFDAQLDIDVEAEQEQVTDASDVTRQARQVGGQPVRPGEGESDGAERLDASGIDVLCDLFEFVGLAGEPSPQQVV